jgi:hypothetical protein
LVAELRAVAASEAGAAIVVRYRLDDDEADYRLVFPNQRQRDSVEYLKDHFRAGASAIGLVVCTDDGRGHLAIGFRPYEGWENERLTMSAPVRHPALLFCRTCHRSTVHIVEDNVRSPHACLHLLLMVATLGLWVMVMSFVWKYWKQACCMVCGTVSSRRTRHLPAPA